MENFGNLMDGFGIVLSGYHLALMAAGVLLGILVGVLPGLGRGDVDVDLESFRREAYQIGLFHDAACHRIVGRRSGFLLRAGRLNACHG